MNVRINLLPHRELRRERRKKDFIAVLVVTVLASAGLAVLVALGIGGRIDTQQARNEFIKRENEKLAAQVGEIAQLREEIDSLKARQMAVENLQSDRTAPVHVLDELVKRTPEGMYFRQLKQVGRKVTLAGLAQSNERVSDLLRSLSNDTPWLEKPELVEIKAITLGKPDPRDKDKEPRRVFEFSLTAMVKAPEKPADDAAAPGQARPVRTGGTPAAPAGKPAGTTRPATQASALPALASR